MLIILPPSETKRPAAEDGPPLDLEQLSFPVLTPLRRLLLGALVTTSREPDALRRLMVGPSLADEVARNQLLHELPTRRAVETYAGVLYGGLDPGSWSTEAWRHAERGVVVVSALWGALRPSDRIPPYRLHLCSRLIGLDRLEPTWRSVLPPVLADAAQGEGPILDLRSPAYRAVGRPGGLDDQTVTLRVRPAPGAPAHIGDVIAKRTRGEAARHLLESGSELHDPLDIADVLASRWPIELDPPVGRTRSWTITLAAAASTVAPQDPGQGEDRDDTPRPGDGEGAQQVSI